MASHPQEDVAVQMANNLERQRNEIALLESMYPEELQMIREPNAADGECEFEIRLDAADTLMFTLPHAYPQSARPHVFLSFGPEVGNGIRKRLRASLLQIEEQQEEDTECVDLVISDFRLALADVLAEHEESSKHNAANAELAPKSKPEGQPAAGLRVVLWMHHLLATGKRRTIVQRSKELGLAGFSKPGYPGAVYVEGEAENVRAFVDELKSMRWQAIQERASQAVPVMSLSLINMGRVGVEEVQGLGDIAESLRSSSSDGVTVADFLLEGMKIK